MITGKGNNLGKARAVVQVYKGLPNVESFSHTDPVRTAIDFIASNKERFFDVKNSTERSPKNLGFASLPTRSYDNQGMWGCFMPQRKTFFIPNYMKTGSVSTSATAPKRRLEWAVIPNMASNDVLSAPFYPYIKDIVTDPNFVIQHPGQYTFGYNGQRWEDTPMEVKPFDFELVPPEPNDPTPPASSGGGTTPPTTSPTTPTTPTTSTAEIDIVGIRQTSTEKKNVVWGVEANPNLPIAIPFNIEIKRAKPDEHDEPTFLCIRINPGIGTHKDSSFDLLLKTDELPEFYDQTMMEASRAATGGQAGTRVARIGSDIEIGTEISSAEKLTIGFLPCLGKLIVYINEHEFIYSRSPKTFSSNNQNVQNPSSVGNLGYAPFSTEIKKVQVWGNCSKVLSINLSPMVFPVTTFDTGIKGKLDASGNYVDWPHIGDTLHYDGQHAIVGHCSAKFFNGANAVSPSPPGGQLPVPDTYDKLCPQTGSNSSGRGYGLIKIKLVPDQKPSGNQTPGKHYICLMAGEDLKWVTASGITTVGLNNTYRTDDPEVVPYACPPFLQRLQGFDDPVRIPPVQSVGTPTLIKDISDDVISITRTIKSPSLFNIEQSVQMVIYNENGTHDDLMEKGRGIRIYTTWADEGTVIDSSAADFEDKLVFTGISMGGNRSEVAGKETITLLCEDYNRLLEDHKIVNSPYYDGMDAFNAAWDVSLRAGLVLVDDTLTNATKRAYLASGYSFQTPRFKLQRYSSLKEGLEKMCRPYERLFYFDGKGVMHFDILQGARDFNSQYTVTANFFRDPVSTLTGTQTVGGFNLVLNERTVEHKVGAVVNSISIRSVDRASAGLVMSKKDKLTAGQNYVDNSILPYKKTLFIENPALGSQEATDNWAQMLAVRVFSPPIDIEITTITKDRVLPTDFISVDGQDFRVSDVTESLNAEDNSLTTRITGAWLGGIP